MSLDLFRRIERHSFSAAVNVVSGYRSFLRALDAQPEVARLQAETARADGCTVLFLRLASLLATTVEHERENPFDVAIAVYLWILTNASSPLAVAAAALVRRRPGFWWAVKIADQVTAVRNSAMHQTTGGPSSTAYAASVIQTTPVGREGSLHITSGAIAELPAAYAMNAFMAVGSVAATSRRETFFLNRGAAPHAVVRVAEASAA